MDNINDAKVKTKIMLSDPYSKKQILGLRLSRGLESQGCQPNICFLLIHSYKEKKCSVGTPAILIRGLISGSGFVFLNIDLSNYVTHALLCRL